MIVNILLEHSSILNLIFREANRTYCILSLSNLHRETQIPKYSCFTTMLLLKILHVSSKYDKRELLLLSI